MFRYAFPIEAAAACFPLLALLLSVPYMIRQYRKFGMVPFWKTFVVFLFVFYCLCAYYLVILPLPEDHTAVVAYAATPQLVPFAFVGRIMETTALSADPSTWVAFLKNPEVYEALFNLALTMPLGIFLRYFFHRKWWQVVLIGFGVTLFFETSQITGLWGLYEHPYRLFDVDDLMVNTLGALVGFWVAGPLCRRLPDIDAMNARTVMEARHFTTFTRRLSAFAIDIALTCAGCVAAAVACAFLGLDETAFAVLCAAIEGVFFMLVPAVAKSQTLGQKALQLQVVRPDGTRAPWYACVLRYALLFWVFLMAPVWVVLFFPEGAPDSLLSAIDAIFLLTYAFWAVSLLVRAVRSARRKPFVMLNGIISGTRVMSLEQADEVQAASKRIGISDGHVAAPSTLSGAVGEEDLDSEGNSPEALPAHEGEAGDFTRRIQRGKHAAPLR